MKRKNALFLWALSLCFYGCVHAGVPADSFTIVNWNVQTFFDGVKDGTEYSEFKKASGWGKDAYSTRLKRLCDCIEQMNADVFVFEELENRGILYDISNQLAGNSWDRKKSWGYGCFAKNEGDAIGCGVLSRFPVKGVKVHNLDIKTESGVQPCMRPIMEVELEVGEKTVILLVNHWKSKSGGEEESNVWREWQESLLTELFLDNENMPVLACGDFNRDITEFQTVNTLSQTVTCMPNIVFSRRKMLSQTETPGSVAVYSPWIKAAGDLVQPGSYFYNEKFERIDHFFANTHISLCNFKPCTDGPWCDDNFIPVKYKIYNGQGYSDHLPVACTVKIKQN